MSTFYELNSDKFKFGWEAEVMVTDHDYNPLFGDKMPFEILRDSVNSITNESADYLVEKYTGSGQGPYYLEGYDTETSGKVASRVDVKGVEIRTPIDFSIEQSVQSFERLYNSLQAKVSKAGLRLCCHGNHPFQPAYVGEKGERDLIGWSSAEVAMTTQGLAINISMPDDRENALDRLALDLRFSYAAPVMVILAANTPFRLGELWTPMGVQAHSERSYRRTFTRNTIYYRDDQHHRKEITLFDATNDLRMHAAYAALSLGIILSDAEFPILPDRFSKENIRRVAQFGYDAVLVDRNFGEFNPADAVSMVLGAAAAALTRNGFNADLLNPLWALRDQRITQAQRTVERYLQLGSIQNVLRENSELVGK
ncbi:MULTISPECIES: glutamate-cysteine ligase family protein [Pseudomonas]|jgi:hypothetical protein|uniref:Glutamate--cysteine ligase n=1 Tax=Pseudomonas gingeri TaxID=117681 RepID=A0A7Y7WIV5_9PSED|nr:MULTISPECIES: glutamate-cysteine ligase family protein [Pseudomonas]MCO8310853.1 glutamate-cysteine ligase family protein [Pseudomonas mandelii]NWB50088.1 hypothetical protein [Pseudomonas gingeri]RBH58968.1 hypothetical protein C3F00_004140 [Pseudomonas sp. MWU13-2860]